MDGNGCMLAAWTGIKPDDRARGRMDGKARTHTDDDNDDKTWVVCFTIQKKANATETLLMQEWRIHVLLETADLSTQTVPCTHMIIIIMS